MKFLKKNLRIGGAEKLTFCLVFCFWLLGFSFFFINEKTIWGSLFLHYGWFLQNLEKGFISTNMHTPIFLLAPKTKAAACTYQYLISLKSVDKVRKSADTYYFHTKGLLCDWLTQLQVWKLEIVEKTGIISYFNKLIDTLSFEQNECHFIKNQFLMSFCLFSIQNLLYF